MISKSVVYLLAFPATSAVVEAFVAHHHGGRGHGQCVLTSGRIWGGNHNVGSTPLVLLQVANTDASSSAEETKKLSSQDILARARSSIGLPAEEEGGEEKLFEDALLDDMKEALLMLEKRVHDGPGSLSSDEVLDLISRTGRIARDIEGGGSGVTTVSSSTVVDAAPASLPPPRPTAVAASTPPPSVQQSPYDVLVAAKEEKETTSRGGGGTSNVVDTSNDEGPDYTGEGGLGLAKGTRNTYLIEGMDEMTTEEYRAALQQSVLDQQAIRRRVRRGNIGNHSAHGYLSSLGWGGASEALSKGSVEEEEKEE